MLELILGRAGTGKTTILRKKMLEDQAERTILLVPEQYTFECERALLETYGVAQANRVQVYSFTRMAHAAFLQYGGNAGARLSDGGRRILMTMAIQEAQDQLTLFARSASVGTLTEAMMTAVGEMKICGITPDMLRSTETLVHGDILRRKLREVALIYDIYEALVAQSYLDPMDDLMRLDALLYRCPSFFQGASVAVDAFDGFTAQEEKILRHILRHAAHVRVALCCDDLNTHKKDLFYPVRKTAQKLIRIAKEEAVSPVSVHRLETPLRFHNEMLRTAEQSLSFWNGTEKAPEAHFSTALTAPVVLYKAVSPYEEAEFVAAEIRNLVMSGAYRYRDISVICRNEERYARVLSSVLRRWSIPAFLSRPRPVDAEPLMRMVLSAFDVVTSSYRSDDILNLLKTGLTVFSEEEIAALENYIFTWSLTGKRSWLSPFEKHPNGYGDAWRVEDTETLTRLNVLRLQIIEPLQAFAAALESQNGTAISTAVYKMLEAFHVDRTLPAMCTTLEADGQGQLAAQQLRIWDLLMSVLDQMSGILGARTIDAAAYAELLREILSKEDVSDIPMFADAITFGTADRIRQSAPKAVFLLGVVQGEFPLLSASNGVFSEQERSTLLAQSLPLTGILEERMLQEQFLAYSVACSASDRLYMTYPVTADKETKYPSEIFTALQEGLSIRPLSDLPVSFFANAPEAAFSQTASVYLSDTPQAAALRQVFSDLPAFAERMQALGKTDRMGGASLSAETAHRLYGSGMHYSASQIESYHKCRFQFFCQYTLGAKERRSAELDAREYGSLMHDLFEKVVGDPQQPITTLTTEALRQKVDREISRYVEERMGGMDSMSPKERYRFDRMKKTGLRLLLQLAQELRQSEFQPAHLELRLQQGTDFPPLRLPIADGWVYVGGIIDRVDLYTNEKGVTYVRVVDYKTGTQEFTLSDVLFGLCLQMLIYLAALVQNGSMKPAGVLYMPAHTSKPIVKKKDTPEKRLQSVTKDLCMKGVVLSDEQVLQAMEADQLGKYIPLKKNGESLLSETEMQQLLEYVKNLVSTMADTLYRGDIAAVPGMACQNPCTHCKYSVVCGTEQKNRSADGVKLKKEEVMLKIYQEIGGGENG